LEATGEVKIKGPVTVTNTVTVTGSVTVSGTVSISGTVAVEGSVTVSGSVSITGTVTVSGAVTVGTVAADNIVIDKLTVGAYTERRSTLLNKGTTPSWSNVTGASRHAKFFPRGARGFIYSVDAYCRDSGVTGGTITVYISPYIGAGAVASATITVPAGGGASWRSAEFSRMWNYDSIFIFYVMSQAQIEVAYDADEPTDGYTSGNAGETWTFQYYRRWIAVNLKALTVGDIPVSGTVNTIDIPTTGSGGASGQITCPSGSETSILTINGSGKVTRCHIYANWDGIEYKFYIDGVQIPQYGLIGHAAFTSNNLQGLGFTATTPQIQLLNYTAGSVSDIAIEIEFEFKRQFEVRAYHTAGSDKLVFIGCIYNKIT
jgi:hypothetical protein